MQLGARWAAGSPPHRGVPAALHGEIAAQEAAHPRASAWTLTWLEGRPRCALDDAIVVTLDRSGAVVSRAVAERGEPAGPGSGSPASGTSREDAGVGDTGFGDTGFDDDDEWLR
ncbi:Fe-S oxidoreductase [Leucobacter allii]|uniref:Fe-S oxidoreductase n=1 Tax=Leucobacter allii TaxID=2932247 RepID=UPI001FD075F8|nr:Fe-S oxidoreductase [Leucobacter allii]UOR03107.1 Fe-S oxidoreductase [Leucobacter allii]